MSSEQTQSPTPESNGAAAVEIRRVTVSGMLMNIFLSGVKITAGLLGHSYAVVADGVHSISDCTTDIAILVGMKYWSAPPDDDHPHGHRRIETVVTILIGIALAVVALGLGYKSMTLIRKPPEIPPGLIAAVAAAISIIVKEGLYRWTLMVGTRHKSSAVIANAWHHRSDVYSSIPALLAVCVAVVNPELRFLDFIGGIIVSLFILHSAIQIAKPAVEELIDAGASESTRLEILQLVEPLEGVLDIHNLRTRYMGSGLHVDLHVMVDPELTVREGHDIAHLVEERLVERGPHVIDVLVHIEPYSDKHDD